MTITTYVLDGGSYGESHIFYAIPKKLNIFVDKFENGVAVIHFEFGANIADVAEIVAGCLDENSNFAKEISKTFNDDTVLKGIEFTLSFVTLMVTKENADISKICDEWNAERIQLETKKQKKSLKRVRSTLKYKIKTARCTLKYKIKTAQCTLKFKIKKAQLILHWFMSSWK